MDSPVPRKRIKKEKVETEIPALAEVEVSLDQVKHESSEDERASSFWSDDEDDLVFSDFSDPDYYPFDRSDDEFSPDESHDNEPEQPKDKSPQKNGGKTVDKTPEKANKAQGKAKDKTTDKAKGKTKKGQTKDQTGAINEGEVTGEAPTPKKGSKVTKTVMKKSSDKKAGETLSKRMENEDGAPKYPELRWHSRFERDVKPEKLDFRPVRAPGPAVDSHGNWTPLSLFQLYFSSSVVRTIIRNTNKKVARRKESAIKRKWTPLDMKDFYIYLSILVYTSLVNVHQWCDFWRKIWPYNFQFPADTMSRARFQAISGSLHLCDPDEDEENDRKRGTPQYDRIFKLKPLYTDIVNSCKAHFQPSQNVSIDERMVATQGRISFKQYVKNKPTKWGYKLFVLADSSTGYTWNFFIYTGKSTETKDASLGYSSVMSLMPLSLLGTGYHLYVDNFYTSPRLFQYLHSKNIGCCGTLRRHVAGIPKTNVNDFPKRPDRGDMRWLRKDNLLFVKWLDTRQVVLCSTVHMAYSGMTIKRTVKEEGRWLKKQMPCPDAVLDYNKNMGGVDLSDALIGYYKVHRKTRRWYKTLFYHFVDIAIVNGFLLYKELAKRKGEGGAKMTQKIFRETLCREMLTFAMGVEPETKKPSHVPASLTCMPAYFSDNATDGRKLCHHCRDTRKKKDVKTPIYCRKCQVPLCLGPKKNCFSEWHDAQKKAPYTPKAKKSL